jgi:methionyl-tRNA synthetase
LKIADLVYKECPHGHDEKLLNYEPKYDKWYCVECDRYYPESRLKTIVEKGLEIVPIITEQPEPKK